MGLPKWPWPLGSVTPPLLIRVRIRVRVKVTVGLGVKVKVTSSKAALGLRVKDPTLNPEGKGQGYVTD